MADYRYIEYSYPVPYNFEKFLFWISANCNCYFALKEKDGDSWSFYAGKDDASHDLDTGLKLVSHATEELAEENYFYTGDYKNADDKVLAILPTLVLAKYVRIYVYDFTTTTIHEFKPSVRMIADELVGGTLLITDELTDAPLIRVEKSSVDRIKIGNFESTYYGIAGYDGSSNKIFELSDNQQMLSGWNFTQTTLSKISSNA